MAMLNNQRVTLKTWRPHPHHSSSTWILCCATETAASATETAARQGLPQGDAPEEQGPAHGMGRMGVFLPYITKD